MTLDEVSTVGRNVLHHFQGLAPSTESIRIEPLVESCSEESGDPITEAKVRSIVLKVLTRLAALPQGTWTTSVASLTIGGVEQRVIYKGNIGLGFRLQHDSNTRRTHLYVAGCITEEHDKATVGH